MNLFYRTTAFTFFSIIVIILLFLSIQSIQLLKADNHLYKAKHLNIQNNWQQIQQHLNQSITLSNHDTEYLFQAGLLYINKTALSPDKPSYIKGVTLLEEAYNQNPYNPYIILNRITLERLALKRKFIHKPSAFTYQCMINAVKQDKYNPTVYNIIASLLLSNHRYESAINFANKSKQLRQGSEINYENDLTISDAYLELRLPDLALTHYLQLLKTNYHSETPIQIKITTRLKCIKILMNSDDLDKAYTQTQLLISEFPTYQKGHTLAGTIKLMQGNIWEAKIHFGNALNKSPSEIIITPKI